MQILPSLIGQVLVMKGMEVHLNKDGSNQAGKIMMGHGTNKVGKVLEVGRDFSIQAPLCKQELGEVVLQLECSNSLVILL